MTVTEHGKQRQHAGQMAIRCLESGSHYVVRAGHELVDAIVAAVDVDRSDDVNRLVSALGFLGLDEAFVDEIRLNGVSSVCNGECWMEAA